MFILLLNVLHVNFNINICYSLTNLPTTTLTPQPPTPAQVATPPPLHVVAREPRNPIIEGPLNQAFREFMDLSKFL